MKHLSSSAFKPQVQRGLSDTRPYRSYFCRICQTLVNICIRCDRGQIYCQCCQPKAKSIRFRKAKSKYNKTSQGKRLRSFQSQRYRLRKKQNLSPSPKFEGDRGSPPKPSPVTPPTLPEWAEKKEEGDERKDETLSKGESKVPLVWCHWCGGCCAPFVRRGPWNRKKALQWFKKHPFQRRGADP